MDTDKSAGEWMVLVFERLLRERTMQDLLADEDRYRLLLDGTSRAFSRGSSTASIKAKARSPVHFEERRLSIADQTDVVVGDKVVATAQEGETFLIGRKT